VGEQQASLTETVKMRWSLFAFAIDFCAPSIPRFPAEWVGDQQNYGLHNSRKRSNGQVGMIRPCQCFVVSHPFAKKKPNGWGTGQF
jgi:hypothetical protein